VGVDASLRARIDRWIEIGGAYDYAFADSDTLGRDPLPRFPHHRAEGWVRGFLGPELTALVRTRYVGSATDSGGATAAYAVTDATLTYAAGVRWLAVLHVEDALDARPETRSGYHTVGRVVSLALQGTWD
jgi:outer membrane receptor protein involved in Fe transport